MTTHRLTIPVVTSLLVLTAFTPGARAQRQSTSPPPTPTPIEQRFERPKPPTPAPTPPTQPMEERLRERGWYRNRPIFRLFQNYILPQGDSTRHVMSVLADVEINGTVRDDVAVIMGDAKIGPTAVVEGSMMVFGGSATIAQGAVIRRDVVVLGGVLDAPVDFVPGGEHVVIGTPAIGESLRAITPWMTRGLLLGRLIVPGIGWVWTVVGLSFLFGLLFNHVFARQVGACADTVARRPLG
jgi:hypothetical protein